MSEEPRRRRSGGRAGRQQARAAAVVESQPYLTRALQPFEVLSVEALEIIEHNADTLLRSKVWRSATPTPWALIFAEAGA